MKLERLKEFEKDLKQLLKRYRTISSDLEVLINVLKARPEERSPFIEQVEGLRLNHCTIKAKKMACRSLKGKGINSGLRLIYAHFEKEKKIVLVELYQQEEKEKEDRERITRNFK